MSAVVTDRPRRPLDAPRPVDQPLDTRAWLAAGAAGGLAALLGAVPGVLAMVAAALGGVALVIAVARRPIWAARIMVVGGPLLVGLERGLVPGQLRLNEVLLVIVCSGIGLAAMNGSLPEFHRHPADTAVLGLLLAGVALPLLVAVGRARGPSPDDVLFALTLVKGICLYAVFRLVHRNVDDLWRTASLSLGVAVALSIWAVFDALNVAGLAELLAPIFPSGDGVIIDDRRASVTVGNPIGFGGYLVVNLALALALLLTLRDQRRRRLLGLAAAVLFVGILASGQVSVWLATVAVVGVDAGFARRSISPRVVAVGVAGVVVTGLMLWPVIHQRIDGLTPGAIPSWKLDEIASMEPHLQPRARYEADPGSSWDVRRYNLETYFLPDLATPENLVLGVGLTARVEPAESWLEFVWIESGAVWLLYVGGIPLLVAFGLLVWRFAQIGARSGSGLDRDPFGFAAAGVIAGLVVLMMFDPHLTIRGTSDGLYPILALAVLGAAWIDTADRSGHEEVQ